MNLVGEHAQPYPNLRGSVEDVWLELLPLDHV
jgi:hypothetical protein